MHTHSCNFFPSIRVVVNDHPYCNFRFFCICGYFFICTPNFIIVCPSIRVAVNGHSYLYFRFFLYMRILPQVYNYIHEFFLSSIRVAINGHSYLHFKFFCMHAFFLMSTPTYLKNNFFNKGGRLRPLLFAFQFFLIYGHPSSCLHIIFPSIYWNFIFFLYVYSHFHNYFAHIVFCIYFSLHMWFFSYVYVHINLFLSFIWVIYLCFRFGSYIFFWRSIGVAIVCIF